MLKAQLPFLPNFPPKNPSPRGLAVPHASRGRPPQPRSRSRPRSRLRPGGRAAAPGAAVAMEAPPLLPGRRGPPGAAEPGEPPRVSGAGAEGSRGDPRG